MLKTWQAMIAATRKESYASYAVKKIVHLTSCFGRGRTDNYCAPLFLLRASLGDF